MATSSTETEKIALPECVQKIRYHHRDLKELGKDVEDTITFEDKQACISWATKEGKGKLHLNIRYHIGQEATGVGEARLETVVQQK